METAKWCAGDESCACVITKCTTPEKNFTNTTLYTKGVEKAGSPNSTGHTTYVAPNGGGVLIHSKDNALQEEVGEEYRWFPCQNMKHGLV